MNSKERVAFHEAGHAIMKLHYKMPFEYVSIIPDETSGGRVAVTPRTVEIDIKGLIEHVTSLYAGVAAEEIYLKQRYPGTKFPKDLFLNDGRQDLIEIKDAVRRFFGDDEEAMRFLNWSFYHTQKKVQAMWGPIEVIAKALLKKPMISYSEIMEANPVLNG